MPKLAKLFKALFFVVLLYGSLLNVVNAQVTEAWNRKFNPSGSSDDRATLNIVDDQGNIYVAGYSTVIAYLDFSLIKYDGLGNLLWHRTYDGPGNQFDEITAIDLKDGYIYVTGYSQGISSRDIAVIKYDLQGNQIWLRRLDYNNGSYDFPRSIAVDGSGNVFITGETYTSNMDCITLKYDALGNLEWTKVTNGAGYGEDFATGLSLDNLGNVIITGYSNNGLGSGDDAITIKYDTNGTILWEKRFNLNNNQDRASGIKVDHNNNIYITGYTEEASAYVNFLTIKFDAVGNFVWSKFYDSPYSFDVDKAIGLDIDLAGNIYIAGSSGSSQNGVAYYDLVTIKYDGNGTLVWENRKVGLNANNTPNQIKVDKNNGIYVIATYSPLSTQSGAPDLYVVKYESSGTQAWEITFPDNGGYTRGFGIAIDDNNNVYASGYTDLGGTGFDFLTIKYSQVNAPLPVTLIKFSASRTGSYTLLEWQTASEQNNAGFEIEGSIDAKTFKKLGYIEGKGTGSSYSFTDLQEGKTGIQYYRLKQLDLDGDFAYSPIRSINFDNNDIDLKAWPNPVSDKLTIGLTTKKDESTHMLIRDLLGQIITDTQVNLKKGSQQIELELDKNLAKGLYLLELNVNQQRSILKIVKE